MQNWNLAFNEHVRYPAHVHFVYRQVLRSAGESANFASRHARRFNMADGEIIRSRDTFPWYFRRIFARYKDRNSRQWTCPWRRRSTPRRCRSRGPRGRNRRGRARISWRPRGRLIIITSRLNEFSCGRFARDFTRIRVDLRIDIRGRK